MKCCTRYSGPKTCYLSEFPDRHRLSSSLQYYWYSKSRYLIHCRFKYHFRIQQYCYRLQCSSSFRYIIQSALYRELDLWKWWRYRYRYIESYFQTWRSWYWYIPMTQNPLMSLKWICPHLWRLRECEMGSSRGFKYGLVTLWKCYRSEWLHRYYQRSRSHIQTK